MSSYYRPDMLQSNTVEYVDSFITRFLARGGVSGALSQLPPSYWTTEGVRTVAFAGGATISTTEGASSITFVFDPISQVATSDYFTLTMIEYTASFEILKSRNIRIGGKITDYESAGVIDFRIEVTPASPPDFASGSCAGGKLVVRPANLASLDVNELARLVSDPTEDIIQGVRPADGGVKVQLINPSLGSVLSSTSGLLEHMMRNTRRITAGGGIFADNTSGTGFFSSEAPGAVAEVYYRNYDSSTANTYLVNGEQLNIGLRFTTPETAYANYEATKAFMFSQNADYSYSYGGGCITGFYDSAYAKENQFTSLTYACDVKAEFNVIVPTAITDATLSTCAIGLDWGGNIVATSVHSAKITNAGAVGEGAAITSWGTSTLFPSYKLVSRTTPINRVVILRMHLEMVTSDASMWVGFDAVPMSMNSGGALGTRSGAPVNIEITTIAEAGVPGKPRPMAVFCLAGVNSGAVFSIRGDVACATTTRDEFAGVSRAPPSDRPLISTSLAASLIETASTELPSVLLVNNVSALSSEATALSYDGETREAVQAMSFKKFGKGLKSVAKAGKKLAKNKLVRSAVSMVPGGSAALEVADKGMDMERAMRK